MALPTGDPRVDKAIPWIISTLCGVAMSFAAYGLTSLAGEVRGMRDDISHMNARVAVADSRFNDIERRLSVLEAHVLK